MHALGLDGPGQPGSTAPAYALSRGTAGSGGATGRGDTGPASTSGRPAAPLLPFPLGSGAGTMGGPLAGMGTLAGLGPIAGGALSLIPVGAGAGGRVAAGETDARTREALRCVHGFGCGGWAL